jgi:hypothetical protein
MRDPGQFVGSVDYTCRLLLGARTLSRDLEAANWVFCPPFLRQPDPRGVFHLQKTPASSSNWTPMGDGICLLRRVTLTSARQPAA